MSWIVWAVVLWLLLSATVAFAIYRLGAARPKTLPVRPLKQDQAGVIQRPRQAQVQESDKSLRKGR